MLGIKQRAYLPSWLAMALSWRIAIRIGRCINKICCGGSWDSCRPGGCQSVGGDASGRKEVEITEIQRNKGHNMRWLWCVREIAATAVGNNADVRTFCREQ
ncbi:hypothetical protein HN51_056893 [Arachis hypogaea]